MLIPVADTIYKLVIPLPYGGDVNCYLLQGEKGYTIIDTGINTEQTIEQWENVLSGGITVEKVVLTHTHPDHFGLAGWFQKRLGVPVIMSRIGYEALRRKVHGQNDQQRYAFFLKHGGSVVPNKRMQKSGADIVEPDDLFDNGQEIRLGYGKYNAVWTPGHAPDHYCFYNPESLCLFAGDHVLPDISPVITFWSDEGGNPLQDYFQSLKRIEDFPAAIVLPGHGDPFPDLKQRVSEIRNGHLFRMRQIIDILEEGGITAGDVSRVLYNNKNGTGRFMMQLQSSLARLTYLESQGEVTSWNQDGLILFSRNR